MAPAQLLGLVDSDLLVYRVGWTTENADQGIAAYRMDEMIAGIKDALQPSHLQHFITSTDKSNFRYKITDTYKATRVKPKPLHYNFLRDYLCGIHRAFIVEGQEADDELGIRQDKVGHSTVLVTIDKDLDMIPGWHYNFVKSLLYKVSEKAAARTFYEQMLVGDKATDNIEGCPGIGKAKAPRILEGCANDLEMLEEVKRQYKRAYGQNWADYMWIAGQLLWIRREAGKGWCLSTGNLVSRESLEPSSKTKESPLPMSPEPISM